MSNRLFAPVAFLICCLFASPAFAQKGLEIGAKGGISVYYGDLSPSQFGLHTEDMNFAGGIYLRYRPIDRFGVRVNGNFGRLSAEREVGVSNDVGGRTTVSRNFRSQLTEFNLVAEFDLFYIGDVSDNFLAPYVYGGVGVLSFNPEVQLENGTFVEVQPLRTEGQGLTSIDPNITYATTPYQLTRVVGIAGGGVRARFGGRFVVGLEIGGRFTGTDYLDDVSSQRVNYIDVRNGPGGTEAARISNPSVADPATAEPFTYTRGGEFNDFYFVGGLTFGITIGGGGSNKTGCYTF